MSPSTPGTCSMQDVAEVSEWADKRFTLEDASQAQRSSPSSSSSSSQGKNFKFYM